MRQKIIIQTSTLRRTNSKSFSWREFFSFRRMITMQLIQVIYFIVAGLISLVSIIIIFSGNSLQSFLPGGVLTGIAILVLGNILWRICCELIIVFFRINKTLSDIDDHTKEDD